MSTGRDRLKNINKKINGTNKERFLKTKMWISYLVSLTTKDRGTIPENIGNNMLITNNLCITKNFLSTVIHLIELSIETPITLLAEMLIFELRRENCTAVIDFTIKNEQKNVNLGDSGLKSRIKMWEMSEENQYLPEKDKKRAIRLLYTIDQVKNGHDLVDSRIFLIIRAKDGTTLGQAERIVYKYLAKIGCIFRPINNSLEDHLKYISLMSNHKSKNTKTVNSIVNSCKTLSQLLPNTHALGDKKGIYCGTNTINNTPFRIDFKNITMGRNIYIITNTGSGKTALALNMCASALEEGYQLCVMDIKGNEFTTLVDAVGGATISLRETSNEYLNSYTMLKEEVKDGNYVMYFKNRINFSKLQMIILSGIVAEDMKMQLDGLLDEFIDYLYTAIGVRSDNPNTWIHTLNLTPYVVYDYLEKFFNEDMREKYKEIYPYIKNNLKMYYHKNGSKSYIFTKEFQYNDLLELPAIRFDFGVLQGTTYDKTIFKLKFEYMSRINAEYVSMNYSRGLETFKVLEESQAVDDAIMEAYAREYTLRRAQRQTTLLIGNSVSALVNNKKSMPLIETTTGLFIGKLNAPTAELVCKYFDVSDKEGLIYYMSKHNEYMRHFLFVNRMIPKALTPIIKVNYDSTVNYKLLTPKKI